MAKLRALLTTPGLESMALVADVGLDREVTDIVMVDDPAELHKAPPDGIVLLTPRLSAEAEGYQFDIWCRRVAELGVTALVLHGRETEEVPRSATRIARRSGVAIACVPAKVEAAQLVRDIGRGIDEGAEVALRRASAAAAALREVVGEDASTAALCERVSGIGGIPVEPRRPERPGEYGVPVVVDGVEVDHLTVQDRAGSDGDLARLLAWMTAEAAGRVAMTRQRATELPIRSRTRILSELLMSDPQHVAELVPRARALGLAVDDWHVVVDVRIDARELDEVQRLGIAEILGPVAMQTVGRSGVGQGQGEGGGAGWHLAYIDRAPLLVRTWKRRPGDQELRALRGSVEAVHTEVTRRMPERPVRCGIGSAHESVEGLRASWAEARAALLSDDPEAGTAAPPVVMFDDLGLHRMLVEWYTTHTARTAVRDLLAPLDALGRDKASTMVRTLRVYLDNQGSLSATATALNLHRNAVSYRLKRILSLLDVDLSDPDQRLAVHLACRAWKLV
ncbi:PucR family transcriptional regulator [Marinactinospora rubrisoli]|uniref:PucR family transcriptional regulator n=1 Tax=Marinactinospora rubrisoli TaxID=2715399 RepID=A0ABW2KMP2_9ACTN